MLITTVFSDPSCNTDQGVFQTSELEESYKTFGEMKVKEDLSSTLGNKVNQDLLSLPTDLEVY